MQRFCNKLLRFSQEAYSCSSFIRQLIISENSCKENRNLLLDCCSVGIRKGENFISTKCMFWKDAEIGKMCTYSMMHAWCCAAATISTKMLPKEMKCQKFAKMIEDQSTIWQIAYISEPRIIVELLIQKKSKNYYTNTTKAISYTVSKDKQTSCQDCHFLTFNKSRSPTFPPESLVLLSFLCRLLLQPTPHRWFWKLFMSIAKKS